MSPIGFIGLGAMGGRITARLLNAGHQAVGYLGYLAGYRYTDEVCADPLFAAIMPTTAKIQAALAQLARW